MCRIKLPGFAIILLASGICLGQVVNPGDLKDPDLGSLQQQYMDDLQSVGRDILAHHFDYPFYLSRKLDLDQQDQERADQRSIRFDSYNGLTVLAVTGNYYAAYSTQKMSEDRRARATFLAVIMPILKAAVPRFQSNRDIQGYAIEVSHHILGKTMGVGMERPENLMIFLPQRAAIKLLGSTDENARQAALLQSKIFLNGQPVTVWLNGEGSQMADERSASALQDKQESSSRATDTRIIPENDSDALSAAPAPPALPAQKPKEVPALRARDTSPQALAGVQNTGQQTIDAMVKALDSQAHFVSYAPPKFIAFRHGIYLELSVNTMLAEFASASRYELAALAFDEHIAHLIRPAQEYFPGEQNFDGLGFSATVHLAGKTGNVHSEAVEFFFPFSALRCYASYDCTGQQLVNQGTVLINGEPVSLDLQTAENRAIQH